jgi:hypothetical protein
MPKVSFSAIQQARQGYTPVRVPTTFTCKHSGLMLWTRHALVSNAGVLIREVIDTILVIAPGEMDTVTVDPLSDTRVLKGDSQFPGAKLIRFLAFDGENQDLRSLELTNPNFNSQSTAGSPQPVEYLRLDQALIDKQTPITVPFHYNIVRGVPPTTALPADFVAAKDWFLNIVLNFEDLDDPDFCQRILITAFDAASSPMFTMAFPIPRLMILAGTKLRQQVIIGMELVSGVTSLKIEEEGINTVPEMCIWIYGASLDQMCSYRVDDRAQSMKLLRMRDMLNNPGKDFAAEAVAQQRGER